MSDFRNYNQDYFPYDTRVRRLTIKRARKGRLFAVVLSLLISIGVIGYGVFAYGDQAWSYFANKYFGNRINAVSGSEMPGEEGKLWLNVMLLGVDQRKNEPSRSDTLMVAMLNLEDKTVQVISIPRDTRVKIEGVSYKTKINHSHALGGVELTKKTVEQLLGIPIHNYVETNFDGFENIVDDLGGVTLDVEKRMYYPAEGINLRKGVQHLNGKKALSYVRFRSDGGGDIPRIARQHKFLKAMSEQVLQPKTLLKLPKIVDELHSNINTDMSVKDLLMLVGEFKNVKPEKVNFADIPGTPKYVNGASYYVVDEEKLKAFIKAVLAGRDPNAAVHKVEEEAGSKKVPSLYNETEKNGVKSEKPVSKSKVKKKKQSSSAEGEKNPVETAPGSGSVRNTDSNTENKPVGDSGNSIGESTPTGSEAGSGDGSSTGDTSSSSSGETGSTYERAPDSGLAQ